MNCKGTCEQKCQTMSHKQSKIANNYVFNLPSPGKTDGQYEITTYDDRTRIAASLGLVHNVRLFQAAHLISDRSAQQHWAHSYGCSWFYHKHTAVFLDKHIQCFLKFFWWEDFETNQHHPCWDCTLRACVWTEWKVAMEESVVETSLGVILWAFADVLWCCSPV